MVPWMRLAGVGPGSRAMQPLPEEFGTPLHEVRNAPEAVLADLAHEGPGRCPRRSERVETSSQEALDACAHNRSVILVQSRSRILTIVAFNHEGAFRIDERFLVAARQSRFELTRQLVNVLRQPHQVW